MQCSVFKAYAKALQLGQSLPSQQPCWLRKDWPGCRALAYNRSPIRATTEMMMMMMMMVMMMMMMT